MIETYDKIATAKRNTKEYKRDLAMQEDWLKNNKITLCYTVKSYTIPTSIPKVFNEEGELCND